MYASTARDRSLLSRVTLAVKSVSFFLAKVLKQFLLQINLVQEEEEEKVKKGLRA